MNIVYFGTDVFLPCFEDLARHHRVLALYTYHNDEDYFTEYAIVRRARVLGIPVHYESITEAEITRYVTEEGCGLFFIAEYNRIIPVPAGLEGFRGINRSFTARSRAAWSIRWTLCTVVVLRPLS